MAFSALSGAVHQLQGIRPGRGEALAFRLVVAKAGSVSMNAAAATKDTLDEALDDALAGVPGCVIAGYVDLSTGIMLGIRAKGNFPQEALDLVSTTAANLFGHADLTSIENWVLDHGDGKASGSGQFEEFVVLSEQLMHLAARSKEHGDNAVVLVARRSANFGMLMAKSRQAVSQILGVA
ncbi:MAG: hypothetical protein R3F54_06485 [Alphaproteobacteria bacterium]